MMLMRVVPVLSLHFQGLMSRKSLCVSMIGMAWWIVTWVWLGPVLCEQEDRQSHRTKASEAKKDTGGRQGRKGREREREEGRGRRGGGEKRETT